MYIAVLGMIGPVARAVTTNRNINSLRKPAQADVVAHPKLLKLGKRLAVGEVTMYSEEGPSRSPERELRIQSRRNGIRPSLRWVNLRVLCI